MIKFTDWCEHFITLPEDRRLTWQPHQRRILDHCLSFDENGKMPYSVIVFSCIKKSGKTFVNAALQAYWGYNVEAPNEIICLANKRDQAVARGFRELKGFIDRNPLLRAEVAGMTANQITLRNGSTILAIPNDYSGEAGSNHGLTCWDEMWGFVSERDIRLYEELCPVPTRKNSIRFISTYAGFEGESKLLEDLYHQVFDNQGNVLPGIKQPLEGLPCYVKDQLFVYWDHEPRMPWQTPEYYAGQKQQMRLNNYLRLHENRWVSSESSMFNMERWDACTDAGHKPPLPNKNIRLYVGVDASVKKDRSAVVSVYQDGDRLKLGPKRFWQPSKADPIDLEVTMEAYLLELFKDFTQHSVRYDPYQFHRSATTLLKHGLPMREYPQTTANLTEIGQNLYDLVEYGNIVLYPCTDLRYEATCAIGKDTGRGLRITKDKSSQKIDQIVALAMAAFKLNQGYFTGCDLS